MIGRPSRPPPATREIVMVSVFCEVWPSGDRTSAFTTTSLLIVSPSNVRASRAGWPGCVNEASARPVDDFDRRRG